MQRICAAHENPPPMMAVVREKACLKMDISKFPEAFALDIDSETQRKIAEIDRHYDERIAELESQLSCNQKAKDADAGKSGDDSPRAAVPPRDSAANRQPQPDRDAPSGNPAGGKDLMSQLRANGINPQSSRPSGTKPSRGDGGMPPMQQRPSGAGNMPGRPLPGRNMGNQSKEPDLFDKAADAIKEKANEQKKKNPVKFYVVASGLILGGLAALAKANSLIGTHDMQFIFTSSLILFAVVAAIPIIGLIIFSIARNALKNAKDGRIEDEINELSVAKEREKESVRIEAANRKQAYREQFEALESRYVQALFHADKKERRVNNLLDKLLPLVLQEVEQAGRQSNARRISIHSAFHVHNDRIVHEIDGNAIEYKLEENFIANLPTNLAQAAFAKVLGSGLVFKMVFYLKEHGGGSEQPFPSYSHEKCNGSNLWMATATINYDAANANYVELMDWRFLENM